MHITLITYSWHVTFKTYFQKTTMDLIPIVNCFHHIKHMNWLSTHSMKSWKKLKYEDEYFVMSLFYIANKFALANLIT